MSTNYRFDVFLSHSSKDKPVVRRVAERLRSDAIKVWFDEWEIRPGDNIPAKIEEGLEHSRVLVLCMSKHAFGSDWAQLEAGTFRFRDPLNKERRFIPLRLDATDAPGSLRQFLYVNWLAEDQAAEYAKLMQACRSPIVPATSVEAPKEARHETVRQLHHHKEQILDCAISADGTRAITCASDRKVRAWNLVTGRLERVLGMHQSLSTSSIFSSPVIRAAWSHDGKNALSCGQDGLRLWDVSSGECLEYFDSRGLPESHAGTVYCIAWSRDKKQILTGAADKTLRLWAVPGGQMWAARGVQTVAQLKGHSEAVRCVSWSADERYVLSGGDDNTVHIWDLTKNRHAGILEGHTATVRAIAWNGADRAISGSHDHTIRVWDTGTGNCLHVLEGHQGKVLTIALHPNGLFALSGSLDKSVRLWDVRSGRCLRVLQGHAAGVRAVAWSSDGRGALSVDQHGWVNAWDWQELGITFTFRPDAPSSPKTYIQYTNAKVLLVGESGTGKSGLSRRLALNEWQPTDSTVGAWATQWQLGASAQDNIEREIWLWDFGGQADQRLVHQLYMDDTSLAILVFDGQKENVFDGLGQWDRDLSRSSQAGVAKLLVAGRIDAGGVRVSREQIESFARDRNYAHFIETSAKQNLGCDRLKQAILDTIRWEQIPWRSAPLLFKRLKEEIVRLKDDGRVLMRFNELREALQLRLSGVPVQFSDDELAAVVSLLTGPGVVWELKFGSWILLQPERINLYAQAVIQTIRADSRERGCIAEERVLSGNLDYQSGVPRLKAEDERFVLLAMHQMLIERGLCLREHTDKGPLLIFPSYYRRERPSLIDHPAVLVSYRFSGFLDEVYATLIVRLHHMQSFKADQLWRDAADFKTLTGKQLGIKLSRRAEGSGELEVYFDPTIPTEERIIFSRYVHEHLTEKSQEVTRLRHYICTHCGTPVGNRDVATRRLEAWLKQIAPSDPPARLAGHAGTPTIICTECERRVVLWDELEQCFANPETQRRAIELRMRSTRLMDNESKERSLVGEVISTVTLAGQICREVSEGGDRGVDLEIEFKTDDAVATGKKAYIHLLSSDAYVNQWMPGNSSLFTLNDTSHLQRLLSQPGLAILIVRTRDGQIHWMEVDSRLKYQRSPGAMRSFLGLQGQRFDVMAVRGWRDDALRDR